MLLEYIRAVAGVNQVRPVTETNPLPTTPLGRPMPGASLSLDGSSASVRAQISDGVTRISIRNTGAVAATYKLGDVTVTATATDHDIGPGERLDIAVRSGEYIAVLGALIKVTQLGV